MVNVKYLCHGIAFPGPSLPLHKEYLKLVILMHILLLNNSTSLAAIDRQRSTRWLIN